MNKFFSIKMLCNSNLLDKMLLKLTLLCLAILLFAKTDFAQQPPPTSSVQPILDTIHKSAKRARRDSILFAKQAYFSDSSFSPHKATVRSAMIPGWGQIYNKQYWKLPLVYAAVGITAGFYIVNRASYRELRDAYILEVGGVASSDPRIPDDLKAYSVNSLKNNRDQFRKYSDLSIIAFIIAWGVNVADATVTAHLKQFNVSDNLSLKINPTLNFLKQPGLSLTFALKDKNNSPTLISR